MAMILFFCFSIFGGVFALFLPETRDREMPDTIYEAQELEKVDQNKIKE